VAKQNEFAFVDKRSECCKEFPAKLRAGRNPQQSHSRNAPVREEIRKVRLRVIKSIPLFVHENNPSPNNLYVAVPPQSRTPREKIIMTDASLGRTSMVRRQSPI
jgi:hypothetical protein